MDDTHQSDKNQKMVLKSIAKWLVIFALIAFVCYKNQDLMLEALEEIQITPVWKLVVCLLLGNLYFIAEGCIISEMTNTCDHRLSVWQGITCAYLCTFFRIATLGSGTGVAQLYYYNLNGIRVSTATVCGYLPFPADGRIQNSVAEIYIPENYDWFIRRCVISPSDSERAQWHPQIRVVYVCRCSCDFVNLSVFVYINGFQEILRSDHGAGSKACETKEPPVSAVG